MNLPPSKLVILLLAFSTLAAASTPAIAAEKDADDQVSQILRSRTTSFCKAVLPAWFTAENGVGDGNVRTLVADCYTGQARLALLGEEPSFPLEETQLSEVPAMLLQERFGMNLDIYAPLSGRTLKVQ